MAIVIAAITGLGMMAEWPTFALWRYGRSLPAASAGNDPIFGRPIGFYLFSLPAWQTLTGWLTTIAVVDLASPRSFLRRSRRRAR